MSHEQLRHWAGKEYKPYDLLFGSNKTSHCLRTSSGAMGRLKKKKESGDFNNWDNPYDYFSWVVYLLVWCSHLRNVHKECLVCVMGHSWLDCYYLGLSIMWFSFYDICFGGLIIHWFLTTFFFSYYIYLFNKQSKLYCFCLIPLI